jgi:uncharacterized membrane protein YidH (DUF202 family)
MGKALKGKHADGRNAARSALTRCRTALGFEAFEKGLRQAMSSGGDADEVSVNSSTSISNNILALLSLLVQLC